MPLPIDPVFDRATLKKMLENFDGMRQEIEALVAQIEEERKDATPHQSLHVMKVLSSTQAGNVQIRVLEYPETKKKFLVVSQPGNGGGVAIQPL